jgi:hypothetical protein
VTGRGAERGDRNIDVLISRLRRKIEANPKLPRIILGDQSDHTRNARGDVLSSRRRIGRAERGRRAPRCAGQARWRIGTEGHHRLRRARYPDEPPICGCAQGIGSFGLI